MEICKPASPRRGRGRTRAFAWQADRCNLVWIILFMQGMGSLFGWNMFITAESFFSSRLDQLGTRWGACVGLYITLVFQITNIVTQLCCAMFRIQRIFGALLLQTAIFVFCLVLVQLEHLDQDTYFILLLSAVALDGAATAVMNAGVYGISGGLPSQFTGAVMQGQAIAGVVPAAAAIVARTVAPGDDKQSAIIYFSVARLALPRSWANSQVSLQTRTSHSAC